MAEIYGEVGKSPVMQKHFTESLNSLWENGTKTTVKAYLAQALS